jgi:hypothetical protein
MDYDYVAVQGELKKVDNNQPEITQWGVFIYPKEDKDFTVHEGDMPWYTHTLKEAIEYVDFHSSGERVENQYVIRHIKVRHDG